MQSSILHFARIIFNSAIKEFLSHYNGEAPKEIEKPIQSNEMKNLTDEWSSTFIDKIPLEDLTNLTVAANYMGINSLLDLCCAKVASLCKDKSEDEILKTFKITEKFSEEEKNKIKSENKWIEDSEREKDYTMDNDLKLYTKKHVLDVNNNKNIYMFKKTKEKVL